MTILATQPVQIQRFAIGLYNIVVGTATMAQVNTRVANTDLNAALNGYYANSFGFLPTSTVAANLVAHLGINTGSTTAAAVAIARNYVTAQLNAAAPDARGAVISNILDLFSGLTTDAAYGVAATAFDAVMIAAAAYTGAANGDAREFVPTATRLLTPAIDDIVGTFRNESFIADSAGSALITDDRINGAAGIDTLVATVESQSLGVSPILSGIEKIVVTAQSDRPNATGPVDPAALDAVQLDFGRIQGVTAIENFNSRADLIFEGVRLDANQITRDLKITMRDTEPGNTDFGVYFDPLSLRSVAPATSLINLRVLDTNAVNLGQAPLKDSPFDQFTFSYSANGGPRVVASLASEAIQNAQTFPAMVLALQAAADAIFPAGSIAVATGNTYTVQDPVSGNNVQGTEIILSSSDGIVFDTTPPGSGWSERLGTPPGTTLVLNPPYTSFNTNVQATSALITSSITLDNVGLGGGSGDLVVGAASGSSGVQRFEITVEDDSKLSTIASTNNALREVYVVNGLKSAVANAEPITSPVYSTNTGSLAVKERQGNTDVNLPGLAAGNASGGGLPLAVNQGQDGFGFTDVRVIDGSAMAGNFDFTAGLSGAAAIAKYLNRTSVGSDPAADNVQFAYSGGAANDTIALTIASALAGSSGRLSLPAQADAKFVINGNAGNDQITVNLVDGVGNIAASNSAEHTAQKLFDNITIFGGEGNDIIRTPGVADMIIDAGAGNDSVITDNSALRFSDVAGSRTVWTVSAAGGFLGSLVGQNPSSAAPDQFMWKGKLTVTYASAIGAAGGVTNAAAAAGINGWESVVTIPTGDNSAVNQFYLNVAIKKAINEDAVLSKLMVVLEGADNTLRINSLVDGANSTSIGLDIKTSFSAPASQSADESAMLAAYKSFTGNAGATVGQAITASIASSVQLNTRQGMASDAALSWEIQGSNSTHDRDNTIDLGAGNDMVVLSSGSASMETIKVSGDDIGKDSIVNFQTGESGDRLDFKAYLQGSQIGAIATPRPITLNTDTTAEADSVTIIKTAVFTATNTFADFTAAVLQAAINTSGNVAYAGITDATLDAEIGVVAIGTEIVMVENNLNKGEYAVFKLTSDNIGADFTAVSLLGIMDFGGSLGGLVQSNLVS